VIVLHGLFGAGGNLGALSRSLRDAYAVHALDLPGHGKSGWLPEYAIPGMAESVFQWIREQDLGRVHIVGHSLGGKVAMQLALSHPQSVISLTVADIAPVVYGGSHDAVFAALKAVSSASCGSRSEAAAVMRAYLEEEGVIQFLLGSLRREPGGEYDWLMDVEGLSRDYSALMLAPGGTETFGGPALFIKGENSAYIQEKHRAAIEERFSSASLKVMQGCGHWLHVEKPDLFNSIVRRHLEAASV
jgi:esterase